MLSTLHHEIRLALRGLLRDKGFAIAAVLSIGLGVGANSAIFSLVDQALLRLLPVKEPERLVLLDWKGGFVGHGWGSSNLNSYPFYRDLVAQTDVFDGAFARHPTSVSLSIEAIAEPVNVEIVTGSYFSVLGIRPLLGRLIEESDDDQPGAHPVVVVSRDYWQNRLGSRSDIVGLEVLVNKHPMTVIGVAAAAFHGVDWGEVPSLWVPTMMKREATPDFDWLFDRHGRWLHVFGRMKPGMTLQQSRAALDPWFKTMLQTDMTREDWPRVTDEQLGRYLKSTLEILPASQGRSDLRGRLELPLLVLLAATTFVVFLACLNVANLYLARGFARRKQTALQLALGASRARVAREPLVQSIIIAICGAVIGLLLAPIVVRALLSFLPAATGVDLSADINPRVFLFAMTVAGLTAVLFGLAPAWQATRAQPALVLKEESSTFGAGVGLRKVLVVGQIALALVLLIGAGLFVRTLGGLRAKGPGFDTTNQVMIRVDPSRSGYTQAQSHRLLRSLLEAFRHLPEAQSVALSVAELLSGGSWNQQLTIDRGQRTITDGVVHCNAVSPSFFDTLGARLTAGRDFNERDSRDVDPSARLGIDTPSFRSVIVNASFARHYFGDRSPIGARIGLGNRPDTRADIEIVGVVSTFSYRGLRETDDQAFFPFFEGPSAGATFWLRTRTESSAAFSSIRATVRQFDPALPILLRTLDDQLDRTLVNERLLATLASAFAALALLLAVIGVYGVMSFVVSRRTREIGIRRALGASQGDTVWLIVREAIVMLVAGVALAVPAVWGLGRFVESQLFGVRAMDWPTIVAASALLAVVAVGASGLPLRRATSISPSQALRAE